MTIQRASFSISLPSIKFTTSLILFTYRTLSTLLILAVCEARDRYEPRDGFAYHRVYVVEHRSAEPEDLAFDSSWGLTNFTLSHADDKANKYL